MSGKPPRCPHSTHRRRVLQGLAAIGVGLPRVGLTQAGADAAPPQADDRLVHALGARAGEPIAVDELGIGARPAFAYPQDPATGTIRGANRLNQVLLVRLDPAGFTPDTLARSVEGVVAYSGVCSHTGCDVTDWFADVRRFKCPCHESEFDPSDGARVIGGPAPWQLAALPLKTVDGLLAVAGEFEGRLGFQQPGLDPFGSAL